MTDTADLREPLNPKQEEILFEFLGQRDKGRTPGFIARIEGLAQNKLSAGTRHGPH